MADEAFALSPINARPSLPTDEDYDAIHEAFMETARGRWFLTEYAKRNRNADTRMVLDAVERIETSIASQRQAQTEAEARALAEARAQAEALANAQAQSRAERAVQVEAQPQIDLWPELSKAFTKVRIEIAQRLVREDNAQAFEAIRAAVETIKSVIWALRERGFDARICDFLDIQANAITDGYTGLMAESSVASETEVEVLAAFDALIEHVAALTRGGDAETEALDAMVDAVADAMGEDGAAAAFADDVTAVDAAASTVPSPEASSADPPEAAPAPAVEAAPIEFGAPDAAFREIYGDDSDIEIVDAPPLEEPPAPAFPTEPELNKQRLYEAKLAPSRSSAADPHAQNIASADDIEIVDIASAETEHAAVDPAPVASAPEIMPVPPAEQPRDKPASLGDALIANGVIQHPAAARPDPLAPFRRMSQAEKVALFT